MTSKFRLIAIAILLMPTVSLAAQSRTEMLEELLESGRFDQLFFHMTPERFNRASVPAETAKQDLIWLRSKAEAGHIPLVYAYAFRLLGDNPNEAVSWYARARIWAFLDAAECVWPTRTPWTTILEGSYGDGYLNAARKTYLMTYLKSADETLRSDAGRGSRPSAKWYCAVGQNENVRPPEDAAIERQKRLAKLLEANQRKLETGRDD